MTEVDETLIPGLTVREKRILARLFAQLAGKDQREQNEILESLPVSTLWLTVMYRAALKARAAFREYRSAQQMYLRWKKANLTIVRESSSLRK